MNTALSSTNLNESQDRSVQACGICSAKCEAARFQLQPWNYYRCTSCGATTLTPLPDPETLSDYYNSSYQVSMEDYARGAARKASHVLDMLRRASPNRGKLLEVGCSYGFFLNEARRDGWDVTGVELDERAAAHAKNKLGLRIFAGSLEAGEMQLDPPYDAIVSFHVIEHLPDPLAFLQKCRKLLKNRGVIILKTPNVASWIARQTGSYWEWLCPPAHIHLFSPKSLELALTNSGFHVEQIQTRRGDAHNNCFELAYALGRYAVSGTTEKARPSPSASGGRGWADRWQVKFAGTVSEVIYYPFTLFVDPVLGKMGLQPELVVVART